MQLSYQETEELLDILKTRSHLEQLYANDLRNLGNRLNKFADNKQNTLNETYCGLRSYFSIHSDLSTSFSKQITSDLIDNLNKYLNSSKENLKNYNLLAKNNEKELKRLQDKQYKVFLVFWEFKYKNILVKTKICKTNDENRSCYTRKFKIYIKNRRIHNKKG